MILRKPYAFLIKKFKLIHMIILILMIYLTYRTNLLISFFNSYLSTLQLNTKIGLVGSLFNISMFLLPILIIIGLVIIMVVMIVKKKPKTYYIYNIIVYIVILIVYIVCRNIISSMEVTLLDIRTVKLIRDITLVTLFFQFSTLILTFVRATGFDIKKFDFVEDLQQLDIDDEDNEEFELEFNFESDRKLRKIRKSLRYIKYFYLENKMITNGVLLVLVGSISIFIYTKLGMYEKVYKENKTLEIAGTYFKVENTYITDQSYKGITINEDKKYIILNVYSRLAYENANPNISSRAALTIGEHYFYPTTNYKNDFYDLGIDFSNQKLTNDFKNFILVYEIPVQISESNMYLKYADFNDKEVTIKLSPKEISIDNKEVTFNLTEKMNFNDTLGNVNLTINSFELEPKFRLSYDFCVKADDCVESYEYIYPKLSGRYDKVLLKLNANLEYDDTYTLTKNIIEFLKEFAVIKYKIDDNIYTNNVTITQIKPVKSSVKDYYIEVQKELLQASNIYIEFNIRGKKYIYNLK